METPCEQDHFNMNFETEYKNIHFKLELERATISDATLLLGDKFHKLPNQTMIEIKKGNVVAYNLMITSRLEDNDRTHFWSNILLTNKEEDLLVELGHYLDDENILDEVVSNWNLSGDETGPAWKQVLK
jgi:hypothetical protein